MAQGIVLLHLGTLINTKPCGCSSCSGSDGEERMQVLPELQWVWLVSRGVTCLKLGPLTCGASPSALTAHYFDVGFSLFGLKIPSYIHKNYLMCVWHFDRKSIIITLNSLKLHLLLLPHNKITEWICKHFTFYKFNAGHHMSPTSL